MRMGKIDTLERLHDDGSNPEGGDRRWGSSVVLKIDTDSNGAVGVTRTDLDSARLRSQSVRKTDVRVRRSLTHRRSLVPL